MKRITNLKTISGRQALLAVVVALGLAGAQKGSAVNVVDLVNNDLGSANGVLYVWVDQQTTGTGVIEPFLRVQDEGGDMIKGVEQGFNTEAGTPWDTKAGIWTHDLQKKDLVSAVIDGKTYYEFLLDINQNKGGTHELLSLNQVQIYSKSTPAGAAEDFSVANVGDLEFDSDVGADGDTTVELDFTRNPGSGAGDMLMYVPASLFDDVGDNEYIVFYTLFGDPNDPNDGFEEWSLREQGAPPPPALPDAGTTAMLLGLAIAGMGIARRKLS